MDRSEKWNQRVTNARLDTSKLEIPAYMALNKAKKVKYFDKSGVLRVCSMEEGLGKIEGIGIRLNGDLYVSLCVRRFLGNQNEVLFGKAVTAAAPGITMEEFLKICEGVRIVPRTKAKDPLDRYIKHIETPSVERDSDNSDIKTIDFIRVLIVLNDKTENLKEELEEHFSEIHQKVLQKIEKSRDFKRSKYKVESLVLSPVVRIYNDSVELIFEVKK